MVQKTLELTIISAKDLKNVNLIGKMDVYVVVSLSDEPKTKQKTPVHQDGGTNPSWHYTMGFIVDDQSGANPNKFLIFQLKHEHSLGADKDLGEVRVSMKELFDSVNGKDPNAPQFLTYQVRRASGKAKGELKFSYKFVDMGHNKPYDRSCSSSGGGIGYVGPPPMGAAYPPPEMATGMAAQPYPPPTGGYPGGPDKYPPSPVGVPYAGPPSGHLPYGGYPPAPSGHPPPPCGYGYGYGYGYPPAGGYPPPPGGYPPYPQSGYPQAQQPQKPKKGNKFGMGLGAGLIGGALGGLVLGEVVDDAFDDCGDFDM